MNIFITATGTGVGKTYTSLRLLKKLSNLGYKVGVFKPIETGVVEIAEDARILYDACIELNPHFRAILLEDIVPYRFAKPAAPYIAKKDLKIDLDKIDSSYEKICKCCDIVIVEGAGGAFVPIEKNLFMYDFAKRYNLNTVLVSRDALGTISDTISYKISLQNVDINPYIAFNIRDKNNFLDLSYIYFEENFKEFYLLPDDDTKLINRLIK